MDEVQDDDGLNLLHISASLNKYRSLEFLLQLGASINLPDQKGRTALHHAVLQESRECFFRLRNHGADEGCEDIYGYTPIDYLDEDSPNFTSLVLDCVLQFFKLLTFARKVDHGAKTTSI